MSDSKSSGKAASNYEVSEDVYNRASGVGGGGISREIPKDIPPIGYRKPIRDPRLVRYDRISARQKPPVPWEVTKDDRLSAKQAGEKMLELYEVYGFKGAPPEILEAFHNALYFLHTLNGASVLQPGRSEITVGGHTMAYSLAHNYLGNDSRRFFRAFADEIRVNNRRVLNAAKSSDDIVAQEKAAWLREVADNRGLSRYPELAHDTADACWDLNDSERAALAASKSMIFSSTVNMADRNRFRPGQSESSSMGSMYEDPTARAHALAAR